MPELPEVECIRRFLARECVGSTLSLHQLNRTDIVGSLDSPRGERKKPGVAARKEALLDQSTLVALERKGKQLAFIASDGRSFIVRLGMSGQLLLMKSFDANLAHVHVSWVVQTKREKRYLCFRDPRRFGSVIPCKNRNELSAHWQLLGPDALSVSSRVLFESMRQSKLVAKAFLLNQARLSGLGNIYVDESLFLAGIHPRTPIRELSETRSKKLVNSIRRVLRESISFGGTTLRDYLVPDGTRGRFQDRSRVYGRAGLLCTRCDTPITQEQLVGRTTSFCPKCQSISPESGE